MCSTDPNKSRLLLYDVTQESKMRVEFVTNDHYRCGGFSAFFSAYKPPPSVREYYRRKKRSTYPGSYLKEALAELDVDDHEKLHGRNLLGWHDDSDVRALGHDTATGRERRSDSDSDSDSGATRRTSVRRSYTRRRRTQTRRYSGSSSAEGGRRSRKKLPNAVEAQSEHAFEELYAESQEVVGDSQLQYIHMVLKINGKPVTIDGKMSGRSLRSRIEAEWLRFKDDAKMNELRKEVYKLANIAKKNYCRMCSETCFDKCQCIRAGTLMKLKDYVTGSSSDDNQRSNSYRRRTKRSRSESYCKCRPGK
eukprot:scpid23893/ scgid13461/ 